MSEPTITIQSSIQAPIDKVWEAFNNTEDIKKWNAATPEWHCPHAENQFQKGGKFSYKMAARDNSMSFEFSGIYDHIETHQLIQYTLDDGRKVSTEFIQDGDNITHIQQTFEPESSNPLEMQRMGWQAILNNFKQYVESKA